MTEENHKLDMMRTAAALERTTMEQVAALERERQLDKLKKENTDVNMQKLEALETAEEVFRGIYWGTIKVSCENDDNDEATQLFNKWLGGKA